MSSTAALELVISLQDKASEGMGKIAQSGGFLQNALSFATGGLIEKGIESIGGAVTGFFSGALEESKQWSQGLGQLDSVLKSTGGSAGVTKDTVLGLANSLSAGGGLSQAADDAVLTGENMLLTFTNIGKDTFPKATQAMLDMATAMNNGAAPSAEELSHTAIQLGKALNDPIKGVTALQKVGVALTNEQKEQIRSMVEGAHATDALRAAGVDLTDAQIKQLNSLEKTDGATVAIGKSGIALTQTQRDLAYAMTKGGDAAGAQKVILDELAKEFGGSAAASAQTFDGKMAQLSETFKNVEQSIGDKLTPVMTSFIGWLGSPEVMGTIQALANGIADGLGTAITFIGDAVQASMPYIQPFVDAISGFVTAIVSGGDIGAAAGTMFQGVGAAVANAWPVVSAALGTLLSSILGWIGASVGPIASALGGWVLALAKWVWDSIPGLLAAAGVLLGQWQAWVQANGPAILAGLQAWGKALWQWIVDVWPAVSAQLGTFTANIWTWISANVGGLLSKLGEWAIAFIGWVAPMIPPMLLELGKLLLQLGVWVVTVGLPAIVTQLAQWGYALGQWIEPNIGPMIVELVKLVQQLGQWLIGTALPTIINKLAEWGAAFINWITKDVLPTLPGKLAEIAGVIFQFFTLTAAAISQHLTGEWIPAFWAWITGPGGVLATIGGMLASIAEKLWGWVTGTASTIVTSVQSIGTNIVEGIKTGISNAWGGFVNWMMTLLGSMLDAIKAYFGIQSPSTVMAETIGGPLVMGIRAGWDQQMPALASHLQGTLGALTRGLQASVNIGLPGGGGGGSRGILPTDGDIGGLVRGGGGGRDFGGGFHISGPVTINAGLGANGAQIASDFLDELNAQLALSTRTRRVGQAF